MTDRNGSSTVTESSRQSARYQPVTHARQAQPSSWLMAGGESARRRWEARRMPELVGSNGRIAVGE